MKTFTEGFVLLLVISSLLLIIEMSFGQTLHTLSHSTVGKLNCAILTPNNGKVDSVLIWMHGLGDNYQGFSNLFKNILPPSTMAIIPNAPLRAVTVNNNQKMNAWFNVKRIGSTEWDRNGIMESKNMIDEIIELQINNKIQPHRILVGGFSQGGSMSILVGLKSKYKLGGIICTSGFVTLYKDDETFKNSNRFIPIYILHGESDNLMKLDFAKIGFDYLQQQVKVENMKITTYKGVGHYVANEEIRDLTQILQNLLSVQPSSSSSTTTIHHDEL